MIKWDRKTCNIKCGHDMKDHNYNNEMNLWICDKCNCDFWDDKDD